MALQKDMIRWSMMQYLGGFLFIFLLLIITTVVIYFDDPESNSAQKSTMLLLWIVIGSVSLYYILSFFHRLSLHRRIKEIQFSSEEVVTIDCKKVRTILTPKGRYSSVSTYTVLEDRVGKKYYYIYPKVSKFTPIHNNFDTNVKGKNLRLICYQNTNFIKFPPEEVGDADLHKNTADHNKGEKHETKKNIY